MPPARYRIGPLARSDLRGIWSYIARDNVPAADRQLDSFYERFLVLSAQPLLGEVRSDVLPDLYSFVVGKYVIYYRYAGNRITVARVLHGSRDVKRVSFG